MWTSAYENISFNLSSITLQEANNLKCRNSFRYNGLIHQKSLGVEPAKDGKGVVFVTKKPRGKFTNNTPWVFFYKLIETIITNIPSVTLGVKGLGN